MKFNRKDFLRLFGVGGSGLALGQVNATHKLFASSKNQHFNMHGYAAPKLNTVRIGLIGVGSRGSGTVRRLAGIDGVDIKALCDIVPGRVEKVAASLKDEFPQYHPELYTGGAYAWKTLCDRTDIDLIYTATPWSLHAPIAVYAMEHDKHVYTELPVGNNLEECWQVVETSERTRKHCYMGCASCHDDIAASILNMARGGFFGEIIHGEGAYIHDRVSDNAVRWQRDPKNNNWFGFRPWRLQENVNRNGNLYPSHGLGPVAQIMDLNYGDQMDYMVSISGNDFTMEDKMKEIAEIDEHYQPYVGLNFRGNMNTSIIRTRRGRTIMLQHDISSPRPNVRFSLVSGTKGTFNQSTSTAQISTGHEGWKTAQEFNELIAHHAPPLIKKFGEKIETANKVSKGRSYEQVSAADWRFIDCLRNGLPIEMDVYDAALWSSITPLSEWSVAHEGTSVKVPDFTSGAWKTNKRGMNILMEEGGTTNLI